MEYKKNNLNDLTDYLAKEFCMDSDEITEMLEIFFESMTELASNAESHLADSNIESLAATGHAIKGSAANINATGISQLGLILENAGKESDTSQCTEAVTALRESIAELHSEFKK
jgi:HPt (histidine-containing phosphotransfer) domain-containing protein